MKISLAVAVAVGIVSAFGPSPAGPGEPPQVTIYTIPEMEAVQSFQVFLGLSFSLLAEVDGNGPMTYRWLSEGDSIGDGLLLLDYFYSETGWHEIRFEATDAEGDTGSDTCVVDVVRLAVETEAWGRIKALFR